jgi:hypothetical protein
VPGLLRFQGAPVRILQDGLGLALRVVAARGELLWQQVSPFGDAVVVDWLGHADEAIGVRTSRG